MAIYTSITDLIGGTPLLELKNYEAENKLEAKILGKLEYFLIRSDTQEAEGAPLLRE